MFVDLRVMRSPSARRAMFVDPPQKHIDSARFVDSTRFPVFEE